MAGGRRIVDAIDDLRTELRTANKLAALRMGTTDLDEDPGHRAKDSAAKARVARRNRLRAEVREALGLEAVDRG